MDLVEILEEYNQNGSYGGRDSNSHLAELNYFREHPVLTWSYLTMLVMSTLIGNVGNFLVIAAVLTCRRLRTKANVFVVNLAVADSCVSTFVQYFSILGVVIGYKFFMDKAWLCHLVASICVISCAASLFNIIGVAMNRYICICHNNWYQKIYTRRNMAFFVCLIWISALLVELPYFIGWGRHAFDEKTMLCTWDRSVDLLYNIYIGSIVVVVPAPAIFYCYVQIFVHVKLSRVNILKHGGRIAKGGSESNSNIELAKTLFIIFMVYLACWLPYAVVVVGDIHDTWHKALHVFTIQVAHTNSSINSVIYGLSNPQFREGYKEVVKRLLGLCVPRFQIKKATGRSHMINSSVFLQSFIREPTPSSGTREEPATGDNREHIVLGSY